MILHESEKEREKKVSMVKKNVRGWIMCTRES